MPAKILAYDIETIALAAEDGGFPPWPLHRPIAIGFATAAHAGGDWTFHIDGQVIGDDVGEADLIRAADDRIAAAQIVAFEDYSHELRYRRSRYLVA